MEKHSEPLLRFKGFTDDWEQRKLGDFSETFSGGTPSVGQKEYYGGSIPFIRSAEIDSNTTELTLTEAGMQNSSAKLVLPGDILYALYGATSGDVAISRIEGAINQAILAIKPSKEVDVVFLTEWLRGHKQEIIGTYLQGGQGNLSAAIIKKLIIEMPSLLEQQVIGKLFNQINNLITLHQRKLDKLKTVKKSMLEKMFPKEGSATPEIRFEGFTEDWEQRKLGDIATETFGGGTPSTAQSDYWGGSLPWFQSSDIYEGNIKAPQPRKYITDLGLNNSAAKVIPANSIAIITRVGVGKLAIIPFEFATSQDFISLHGMTGDIKYIARYLSILLKKLSEQVQGTSIKGVSKSVILQQEIMLPSQLEQSKIGSYFSQLDDLITLHQRKLEKLQIMKKAFLDKMFV